MAVITGLTASRMQEIIDATIVDADVVGTNLILTKDDGSTIDAGKIAVVPKVTAFPVAATDGDMVVRTDLPQDPLYKFSDGVWVLAGSGLAKVTAFPGAPFDGDAVIRTDLNGSPIFTYSTENGWEQMPRMGAVTVPSAKIRRSTNQSIPNSAATIVSLDTADHNTDTMYSGATPTRLTIKTPGLYLVSANVEWAANAVGSRNAWIQVNGNALDRIVETMVDASGAGDSRLNLSQIRRLSAGDYIELAVYQSSGGSLNIATTTNQSNVFSATWLGGPSQTIDERGVSLAAARRNSVLAIPNGAVTVVPLNVSDQDTDGMYDSTNGRLVCKSPGRYRVSLNGIDWQTNSTGYREVYIRKNGTIVAVSDWVPAVAGGTGVNFQPPFGTEITLAAGDYVDVAVYQNSGTTVNIGSADPTTYGQPQLSLTLLASAKTVTPFARVYKTTGTQSVPDGGTDTALTFDAEESDNDAIHDNVTNNTRLTCRTAGIYHIRGLITVQANATGTRWAQIRKNGSVNLEGSIFDANDHATVRDTTIEISTTVELAVGDYVELTLAIVEAGTALPVSGGQTGRGSKFSMVKVGAPNVGNTGIGPAQAQVFTLATLPAANTVPNGRIVGVSDGAAGQQARMSMNGAWINLG
jgi:hypothetical protein